MQYEFKTHIIYHSFYKLSYFIMQGEIEEYKMKMKALNARPIKKIAEAKARKKRKVGWFPEI